MKLLKNKKGFEMSINIIVMLVIGLTIMGLVIAFVQNLIGGASKQFDDKLTEVEAAEKEAVLSKKGIFEIGPDPLNLPSGGKKTLFLKVKNVGGEPLDFTSGSSSAGLYTITVSGGSDGSIDFEQTQISGACKPSLITPAKVTIVAASEDVIPVQFDASGCNIGDQFFLSIVFKPDSTLQNVQFSKTLTVTVKE